MKRMISRWRSAGAFPRAVSRRISPQLVSRDRVKCKTHNFCSASAEGESFLHPATWQVVPMGTRGQDDKKHSLVGKSSARLARCAESYMAGADPPTGPTGRKSRFYIDKNMHSPV